MFTMHKYRHNIFFYNNGTRYLSGMHVKAITETIWRVTFS